MQQVFHNFKVFMKQAWEIERRYFLYLFLSFVGIVIFSYYTIQTPKIVLDMIESSEIDIYKVLGIFMVLMVSALLWSYSKVLYTPIGHKIRYRYLLQISEQYISIPYEKYDDPKIQSDVWKIMRPVSSIDGVQAFYTNIALFVGNLGIFFVSIGILLKIQWWISAMIFIWFGFYTALSIKAANKVDEETNKNIHLRREEWYLDDIAVDVAYGKEIRVFQLQRWLENKLITLHDNLNILTRKNETTYIIPEIANDIFQFIRDSLIYVFLITLYFKKQISIGEFTSYSVLILQLNSALMAGTENIKQILSKHDNYKKMIDFINIPKQSNEGRPIDFNQKWTIEFNDVWFKYPECENWIYENLNFTIEKGKKIAIVGLNGVGKTTLLKLLLRLYRPTKGTITLNGIDIWEYKLDDYFELFAPVFQEINIFPFTIVENMSFGRQVSKESILRAIEDSGLKTDELNNGDLDSTYMTRYIHSDGLNLSGGQSQKFVTARAFASKRPIYILDEPTSALDAVAEYDFYYKIDEIMKEHTVLFVSHRLASTQFCNEIVLIENGTIAEKGTHKELLDKSGRYSELFKVQAKYYQSGEAI
ncbi:MAG: ABC transporter ATP-binding protein/permease [Tissierellaceae bacterium]|nr:ABC transporter ATP-binding protein/permease [Tissierellaceae bacterium]